MFFDDADRRDFCVYEIYSLSLAHTLIHIRRYLCTRQNISITTTNRHLLNYKDSLLLMWNKLPMKLIRKKVQTLTKSSSAPQPLPLAVQMVEKGKKMILWINFLKCWLCHASNKLCSKMLHFRTKK